MSTSTPTPVNTTGGYVQLDGEEFFMISNSHAMDEFYMSLVGSGDHWMFVSSTGALSAGRRNADNALFPYAADDQISAARATTGPLTLVRTAGAHLWEPFAPHDAGTDRVHRNLYKNPLGTKLVFEEANASLGLTFRYRWTFSKRFGFVRTARITNTGDAPVELDILDGIQNVLPAGVESEFLMRFSNLANAYKKSELLEGSNLALYYLSSVPTDRAEPSEGLRSTVVWQTGAPASATLVSSAQVRGFRHGSTPTTEFDARGKAGAFLTNRTLKLDPGQSASWHIVAELAQDHSQVAALDDWLKTTDDPSLEIGADIQATETDFRRIIATSDGVQAGANRRRTARHFSNTVFNVMRGGIPLENYAVHTDDFRAYVAHYNRAVAENHGTFLTDLPATLEFAELQEAIAYQNDPDLTRIGAEYLPLAFSRRHGDPTRPWNRFSIDLESADGRTNLNYQGNWRDIFQNWEALMISFPGFSTAMIGRFLNATTADGYNPYRLTRDGFEWEEPTPEDPWANIGYWGDHQIIYLLKLLEWTRDFDPQRLDSLLNQRVFAHANVPYRIKGFEQIKADPRDTIEFDALLSKQIATRVAAMGADGKLLRNADDDIHRVTLVEKLFTLSLAKLSNFIPGGGIWLNTQRPEWNDANNALVGNGLSMVTACYLHRWFRFLHDWLSKDSSDSFTVSSEVAAFFNEVAESLRSASAGSPTALATTLSRAGATYRANLYADRPSGHTAEIPRGECVEFFEVARVHLEETIRQNRRPDGLYHSYNLLDWQGGELRVEHLYEMLEGQVAALSSGLLEPAEAIALLDALRSSALYRANQDSYLLYPDRNLPRFLEKNQVSLDRAVANPLVQSLLESGDRSIVERDIHGAVHFHGDFRNSHDLRAALGNLAEQYASDVDAHGADLVQLFDETFAHRQFTGRSGTFFAYEGLGSIYWHMVSKLAYAVSENYFWAAENDASESELEALNRHLVAVRHGIGAEKSPVDYGAFPSDAYSHTPENAGVKQPGMTGQVKEDVLARFAELGVHISDGRLHFRPHLFDLSELLDAPAELEYFDLEGNPTSIEIPAGAFGFTLAQVPVTYQGSEKASIDVYFSDGSTRLLDATSLDRELSRQIFTRSGTIKSITCSFPALQS